MAADDENPTATAGDDQFSLLFKVVLTGDCGVGKTCVVTRFKCGTFVERHASTIGVDFSMKTISVDGQRVKLQIWDTAGQERFRTLTQSYYRSAHGVVLVYDVTRRASFTSVQRWLDEIRRFTTDNVAVILIGNKCDMADERVVTTAEGEALFHACHEIFAFVEVSAKFNERIDDVFHRLARVLASNAAPCHLSDTRHVHLSDNQRSDCSLSLTHPHNTQHTRRCCH